MTPLYKAGAGMVLLGAIAIWFSAEQPDPGVSSTGIVIGGLVAFAGFCLFLSGGKR